jgi:hypothetical protein
MTIKELLTLAKQIHAKWNASIVKARPAEQVQLQAHLGTSITYIEVTTELDRWIANLSSLSSKPRVSLSISKPLLSALTTSLQGLSNSLDHAANSVDWICTYRNFGGYYVLSIALLRELTLDSAREVEAMTDAAKERISLDIGSLQSASEQARNFTENWPILSANITTIENAEESVESTIEKLNTIAAEAQDKIAAQQEEVNQAATDSSAEITSSISTFKTALSAANIALTEAQNLHTEAQKIRGETQSTAAKTKSDLDNSSSALAAAIEQEQKTQVRLTKALQNAQMEGLAGSFTRMKDDTSGEIVKEQKRFEWALIYLVVIAAGGLLIEASSGFTKTTIEEFSFRMLKMLSLAAPVIWVAWATARKLSALNRVFSDYQYKSASALAYESYRQTVAEAGNDELKQQLLAFAIHSFGENPTRYYDSAKAEASSPFESILEKIPLLGKEKSKL